MIQNSVAIGANVTITGGTPRNIGRFYGLHGSVTQTVNNYAFNGMRLFEDSAYDPPRPTEILYSAFTPTPAHNNKHGADVGSGALGTGTATFWEGLGFTSANGWNYSMSKRHPVLLNVGGQ